LIEAYEVLQKAAIVGLIALFLTGVLCGHYAPPRFWEKLSAAWHEAEYGE
jgi:hypothetical protein